MRSMLEKPKVLVGFEGAVDGTNLLQFGNKVICYMKAT